MNHIDNIMEQAQVFASAWALAGGRFDSGDGFEVAEQEKQALRAAIEQALAVQPKQEPVAWMWKDGTLTNDPDRADGTWTPLYAAPHPQPKQMPQRRVTYVCPVCAASLERQE